MLHSDFTRRSNSAVYHTAGTMYVLRLYSQWLPCSVSDLADNIFYGSLFGVKRQKWYGSMCKVQRSYVLCTWKMGRGRGGGGVKRPCWLVSRFGLAVRL